MDVIAVIGSGRMSGKTATIESLVRELTCRGKKVGTVKQIHEDDFTVDTKEKDTWRHAEAGAKVVVSAAPHEVAAIKRVEKGDRLSVAMHLLEGEGLDYVFVEGNPGRVMPIIFAAGKVTNVKTVHEFLKAVRGKLICVSAFEPERFGDTGLSVPVLHPTRDVKKMADLVESRGLVS